MSAPPNGVSVKRRGDVLIGFGTAHLYADVDVHRSEVLLQAAADSGLDFFDTAPSYGSGASEVAVGTLESRSTRFMTVTTKVGLEPALPRSPLARRMSRLAPPGVRTALRRRSARMPTGTGATGRFAPDAVRASVDRSLDRLGHLDRLLLHEVAPDDVDDALLAVLGGYVDEGSVTSLGVATAGHLTARAMERGRGLFSVAQLAVGPYAGVVELDPDVTRIGHGVFGAAGADLARIRAVLAADRALSARWDQAVAGTPWAQGDGVAQALLQRACASGVNAIVVATSRVDALVTVAATVRGASDVDQHRWSVLDDVVREGTPGRARHRR